MWLRNSAKNTELAGEGFVLMGQVLYMQSGGCSSVIGRGLTAFL